ncbi:MAG: methanol--corrinoid methyltransferase, partial [Ignavibacteriales bacterium]|nr:methanol--corrinoid methyltransferase [Ignavibacteriales bacterium]
MRRPFRHLTFSADNLVFGQAKFPVSRNGVVIGAGDVIPEINFTLPPMDMTEGSFGEVKTLYSEMMTGVCQRAIELHQKELVVEFELLPPMTIKPAWGETLTHLLKEILESFRANHQLTYLLRITPVDIRELQKPPKRIEGEEFACMMESFRRCALAGGDL